MTHNPSLEKLSFNGSPEKIISDVGLVRLGHLEHLQLLNVQSCPHVTDDGVRGLAREWHRLYATATPDPSAPTIPDNLDCSAGPDAKHKSLKQLYFVGCDAVTGLGDLPLYFGAGVARIVPSEDTGRRGHIE